MLYIIQRDDNLPFRLVCEIDKKYCESFNEARKNGKKVLVYQSKINLKRFFVTIKRVLKLFYAFIQFLISTLNSKGNSKVYYDSYQLLI